MSGCDYCDRNDTLTRVNGATACPDHIDAAMKAVLAPVKAAIKVFAAPVPNAVECGNCAGISRAEDPQAVIMCVYCGTDDYLMPIVITPCPNEHPADCDDENHHFGLNAHVDSSG